MPGEKPSIEPFSPGFLDLDACGKVTLCASSEEGGTCTVKQLKIGTMAEVCSTTPRALRHYQDEGILQPEIVDEESGYRSYSIMQSTKLDMITQLQSAGFTLREIAQIENAKDIDYLHDQAQARSAELERQIQELMLAKKTSDDIVLSCEQYRDRSVCGRIMLERIPERRILVFGAPTDADLGGEDDDYTENERWEWYQQYTKRRLIEGGYPLALFRRVGCYVPQDEISPTMDLLHSRPFVFVDESFGEAFAQATPLPGGTNLTVYYDSCHSENGAGLDETRPPALLDYARDEGYEIAGPFVMENIFRYMRFFNSDAHSYYRHCLPVRRP